MPDEEVRELIMNGIMRNAYIPKEKDWWNGALLKAIEKQDLIDRKGEWIDMGDFEQCSVCKGTRLKEFQSYYGKTTWVKTPYCPNCGAKMKGEDDE